jgi:Protein of unknown function (DUF2924)
MKPPVHDASARQHSGELSSVVGSNDGRKGPSPGLGRRGNANDGSRGADSADVGRQIAELVDRSTDELRIAWRQFHRAEPPHGLSRDLMIRGLANQLQERADGGSSRVLQRRLQILTGKFEKSARSFHPGIVLKSGTSLVRQWRGHTHTVVVREDGFEYDGQRYRSLTVIAEKITGAHWSGPRFFGVRRARAS